MRLWLEILPFNGEYSGRARPADKEKRMKPGFRSLRRAALVTSLAGCAALSAAAGRAEAQDQPLVPVKLTYQPRMLQTFLTQVAIDEHFFEKAGIKPEPVVVSNVSAAVTALASGSVDVATNSPDPFLALADKGQPLKLIAGQAKQLGVLMFSKSMPAGTAYADAVRALKGKKIGVPSLRSGSEYAVDFVLESAGMKPADVTFVPTTDGAAALANGLVDAAMLAGAQITMAEQLGAHVGVDLRSAAACPNLQQKICGIAHIGMWTTASWAQSHPQQVQGIRRAMAMADAWVHDPKNAAAVQKMLLAHVPQVSTPALQQSYVASGIAVASALYPKDDLRRWIAIDHGGGIVKTDLKVDSVYAAGTPQTAADLQSLLK
jgi:NitT/TauT family transport system substrate-binding protein